MAHRWGIDPAAGERMRRRALMALACSMVLACSMAITGMTGHAQAHERVLLTEQHTSASRGPTLADGTIARAAFASFDRVGQRRGLRVQFTAGQQVRMELLIPDSPPANRLPQAQLPEVVVIAPDGSRSTMRTSERTPFFEPYSGTSYLYLARLRQTALTGTYRVLVTSRSTTPVTAVIGIGYREVAGHGSR